MQTDYYVFKAYGAACHAHMRICTGFYAQARARASYTRMRALSSPEAARVALLVAHKLPGTTLLAARNHLDATQHNTHTGRMTVSPTTAKSAPAVQPPY